MNEKTITDQEVLTKLKLKIVETRARIAAGKEKNVRAAKNLRRELVRKLMKK